MAEFVSISALATNPSRLAEEIVRTWLSGDGHARKIMVAGLVLLVTAIVTFYVSTELNMKGLVPIVVGLAFVGLTLLSVPAISRSVEAEKLRDTQIVNLEQQSLKEEAPPRLAWDIARIKLESYLDRNLTQVSAIFGLVSIVMFCGMILIGIGVWRGISDPTAITPAILAALVGVVVQAIAGTFLVIYRSTMEQANSYVVVLERINAVGMSLNILESIEGSDPTAKNGAKVEIARELLNMYGIKSKRKVQAVQPRPKGSHSAAKAAQPI